jgi:hypothetical protein
MTKRIFWWLTASLILILSSSSYLTARVDDSGDKGYTEQNKEFYLSEEHISFVRPGLELEILDVTIPSDLQPVVRFKLTDPEGLPLDREGIFTPGPVETSFIMSYIPAGEEAYIAYTTRIQTSPITGDSAEQASTDSGGTYETVSVGEYIYKFATVLPSDYDVDATTTLGVYARRDLRDFELARYVANELDHFVPSGNGTPAPRDIVTTETCNGRCHDPLAIHGGSRQEVGLCILCHNPTQGIDPDTGSSVDMPVMIHKIHAGAHLENGYVVIGYMQGVHDYGEVEYPAELNECESCHTGGVPTTEFPMVANPSPVPVCDGSAKGATTIDWEYTDKVEIRLDSPDGKIFSRNKSSGSKTTNNWVRDGKLFYMLDQSSGDVIQEMAVDTTIFGCATNPPGVMMGEPGEQHTAWMTRPSRAACGACHDDIDFTSGEDHPPQANDDSCSTCHVPSSGTEYDRSVDGAHTVAYKSNQLAGVLVEILEVESTAPGSRPRVTFSLGDKYGSLDPAELSRLRFAIAGPNEDFDYYVQEEAVGNLVKRGANWTYQFKTRLPVLARGSYSIGVEGRIDDVVINAGEENEFEMEDQIQNFIYSFAVTDEEVMPRRMVVDDAKCEACHLNLSLHGSNRHDATGYCDTCHRPDATDAAVRPAGTGPDQSIHFKYMIHKIHRGIELERGYVVYGYRSALHDFSHVEFPGDLRNCESCHVDDSYTLPLPAGVLDTVTPRDYWDPMQPAAAACLSCHDSLGAAAHAEANTSDLGESCSLCHGTDAAFSVERVHAR